MDLYLSLRPTTSKYRIESFPSKSKFNIPENKNDFKRKKYIVNNYLKKQFRPLNGSNVFMEIEMIRKIVFILRTFWMSTLKVFAAFLQTIYT